jgi:hypothetical protein
MPARSGVVDGPPRLARGKMPTSLLAEVWISLYNQDSTESGNNVREALD